MVGMEQLALIVPFYFAKPLATALERKATVLPNSSRASARNRMKRTPMPSQPRRIHSLGPHRNQRCPNTRLIQPASVIIVIAGFDCSSAPPASFLLCIHPSVYPLSPQSLH